MAAVLPPHPSACVLGLPVLSSDQTLPHAGQHLSSFPPGEKAVVSVCVHASLTTCGSICMVGQRGRAKKKGTFTKSRREVMGYEKLCDFVFPELAPEKVLFHRET